MVDLYQTHTCEDGRTLEFIWDGNKDETNQNVHKAAFTEAIEAFCDPKRVIFADKKHSRRDEKRLFLLGKVKSGLVLTVRFTRRDNIFVSSARASGAMARSVTIIQRDHEKIHSSP